MILGAWEFFMKARTTKRRATATPKTAARRRRTAGVRFEHPLIVKTPGVCGGSARIIRTRIPVWLLEEMRIRGVSEADILRNYPTLSAMDLVQAWAYVADHQDEVTREIKENDTE